mmetsp:Transcript_56977/g.112251  ORF Transcript_56977/g.112251 Transcript_56977/m.112251 type:complete len:218 (-) Transcript_56977:881-1534(-)
MNVAILSVVIGRPKELASVPQMRLAYAVANGLRNPFSYASSSVHSYLNSSQAGKSEPSSYSEVFWEFMGATQVHSSVMLLYLTYCPTWLGFFLPVLNTSGLRRRAVSSCEVQFTAAPGTAEVHGITVPLAELFSTWSIITCTSIKRGSFSQPNQASKGLTFQKGVRLPSLHNKVFKIRSPTSLLCTNASSELKRKSMLWLVDTIRFLSAMRSATGRS